MSAIQSKLVGRKIKEVSTLGKCALEFVMTTGEPVVWQVEGDCCSYGIFTDIIGKIRRLGLIEQVSKVDSLVDMALNPAKLSVQEKHDDCEQIYGVLIVGQLSEVLIVHRNWSNGYYGNMFSEL